MPEQREFCIVERNGHILEVTINRPESRNACHPPANTELDEVFNEFAADDDLWIAVLTGAGDKAFSAGNDLKYQASGGKMWSAPGGFAGLTSRFDLDKPVIAAVNGFAMGGGFEIALACDLIVAAENAIFALPEPRVGLAALAGGLHRLPRAIGVKRAMSMILTGRLVPAAEGKDLGFVHQVVPPGESMNAARQLAEEILQLSPLSVRASKQTVLRGLDNASLEEALASQRDLPAVQAMMNSEDLIEGPKAFAEKRPPQWKGR